MTPKERLKKVQSSINKINNNKKEELQNIASEPISRNIGDKEIMVQGEIK